MNTDPIADFLTRIRNASRAGHTVVEAPASKIKIEIAKVALKYDKATKTPVIRGIDRVSTPGLRKYFSKVDMPRVKYGLGIAIVTTSKGLMTDKEARQKNVGGEVICYVY
jgi:small subunit ribosomal protein S8